MSWLAFSYSLSSSKKQSSTRVALWRRLQRIGAIAPKSGVYVLPDKEDCLESFQWLTQEVQQTKGEAVVMKVEKFEGLSDSELIDIFRKARKKDYEEINKAVTRFEEKFSKKVISNSFKPVMLELEKIKTRVSDILRIDFFNSLDAQNLQIRLQKIQSVLIPSSKSELNTLLKLAIKDYQNKVWVTRPRPHVDRLACAWLIRRFIDPNAKIRYTNTPEAHELPFDMKGVVFGHFQNLCSFETIMTIFKIEDAALKSVAEVIHEIDLRDGRYFQPETDGVSGILKGWLHAGFTDEELESHGIALFEGLYRSFSRHSILNSKANSKKK